MKIELIYDRQCPNVEAARHRLAEALKHVGLPPEWKEWNQADASSPEFSRRFGSPTILVDGRDVGGAPPGEPVGSCRLYQGVNGMEGVPSVEAIASALAQARPQGGAWGSLATGITAVVGGLPIANCPACWPVYAGVLGSIGLGFLMERKYLLPLLAAILAVAISALALSARKRHGYGPLWLAVVGGALLLSGKFVFPAQTVAYGGVGLLMMASLWNAWPVAKRSGWCCTTRRSIGVNGLNQTGLKAGRKCNHG